MDILRVFPDRLQDLINNQKTLYGKTIDTIGKEMGCSKTSLSEWQNGKKYPNSEQLVKIARYFKVTTDYLLGLTDTPALNADIRQVADYTGLWGTAISMLHIEKEAELNEGLAEFLSYLATHEKTETLVQAIKKRNSFIGSSQKCLIDCGISGSYEMPMESTMKAVVNDIFWKILEDYNVKPNEFLLERRVSNGSNHEAD